MTNRIKGPDNGGIDAAVNRPVEKLRRTATAGGSTTNAPPRGERVTLTDTAIQLSGLQQAVAKLPEVNQARVERVRQSLARGEYAVDSTRIADQLLQLESDLSGSDPKSSAGK